MAGTQGILRPSGRDLSRFAHPGSPGQGQQGSLEIAPAEERFYVLPYATPTPAKVLLGEFSRFSRLDFRLTTFEKAPIGREFPSHRYDCVLKDSKQDLHTHYET
jgi:hypothetical protein